VLIQLISLLFIFVCVSNELVFKFDYILLPFFMQASGTFDCNVDISFLLLSKELFHISLWILLFVMNDKLHDAEVSERYLMHVTPCSVCTAFT